MSISYRNMALLVLIKMKFQPGIICMYRNICDILNLKGQKPTKFKFFSVAHEPVGIKSLLIAHFWVIKKCMNIIKQIVHICYIYFLINDVTVIM